MSTKTEQSKIESLVTNTFFSAIKNRLSIIEHMIEYKIDLVISDILDQKMGIYYNQRVENFIVRNESLFREKILGKLHNLDDMIDALIESRIGTINNRLEKVIGLSINETLRGIVDARVSDAITPMIDRLISEKIESVTKKD